MSHRTSAQIYARCGRGRNDHLEVAITHQHGVEQHGFTALRCRSTEPPPAANYDAWLKTQLRAGPRGQHGRTTITGEKLRRAVRMIRNGYSRTEAGRAVGVSNMHKWIPQLPPELAP